MRGEPMVWIQDQNGCIVSTSHRLNHDGYLRIRDHRYEGTGRKPLIMAHRLVWEEANGVQSLKAMRSTISATIVPAVTLIILNW